MNRCDTPRLIHIINVRHKNIDLVFQRSGILSKAQYQLGVNDYLAPHLSDSGVNNAAFLDTVGGRDSEP